MKLICFQSLVKEDCQQELQGNYKNATISLEVEDVNVCYDK
ncbi:hypothetical protein TheetDRAFT_3372, partial [Thermoanaerobacter ethanolicus JW 200]